MWLPRLQDICGKKEAITISMYRQSKIPALRLKDETAYCYGLTPIAVDLIKIFTTINEIGNRWSKVPKTEQIVKSR